MTTLKAEVSVKGTRRSLRAIPICPGATVVVRGHLLTVGEIHDEFWLPRRVLPTPEEVIAKLRGNPERPDVFTFAQGLTDLSPHYSYHLESENLAVAQFASHEEWFENKVNRSVRKHVRKAAREGIVVEPVSFSDDLVRGIEAIYNELPVRQGRPFWHYGKSFEDVKADNATYLERSIFVGAREGTQLVGFIKMVVVDPGVAAIMQILSMVSHFEKRPTNALLSKAVEICAAHGISYLIYGEYVYGTKEESSLIEFKRNNGFLRVDVPRYYVPLTAKGRFALRAGLHKHWTQAVPPRLRLVLTNVRARWHALKQLRPT
jgi:hypothetical protein